jgi:hypothetical protein
MVTRYSRDIAPPCANVPGAARQFWLHRAGYGLLLGAAIAALEFAYFVPLVSEANRLGAAAFATLLMAWCGEGVLLLLTVGLAEWWLSPREPRAWQLALAVAVGSVAGVILWLSFLQFVLRDQFGIPLPRERIGVSLVWIAGILYHAWMMLFFGGLAVAAYASERRRARMLSALRTAELDRATSQQRLAETRLAALQARVDPDFLIQTLARFERLHTAEPAAADRVLDELIAYLRKALADLRTSASAAPTDVRMDNYSTLQTNMML